MTAIDATGKGAGRDRAVRGGESAVWKPLPVMAVLEQGAWRRSRSGRLVLGGWLASVVACVAVTAAVSDVARGGPELVVVLCSSLVPIALTLPLLFWLGTAWALVPACLASLASAAVLGVSPLVAVLVAAAASVALLAFAAVYSAAPLRPDLHGAVSLLGFAVVGLGAALVSSWGALAWARGLAFPPDQALVAWYGWWVGLLLLVIAIDLPLLVAAGGRVEALRRIHLPVLERVPSRAAAALTAALLSGGAVAVLLAAGARLRADRVRSLLADPFGSRAAIETAVGQGVWAVVVESLVLAAAIVVGLLVAARRFRHGVEAEVEAETARLRDEHEGLTLAAEGGQEGYWDLDLESGRVRYSASWRAMLGVTEEELGETLSGWFERVHSDDRERLEAAFAAHREGYTSRFEAEYRIAHHDGTYRWMVARGLCARRSDGRGRRIAGVQRDVTELKTTEAQLTHDAFHDELTGLPNRGLFLDRLARAIARSTGRLGSPYTILFLDLDRFKVINDTLGHAVGDCLLVAITERIAGCVRPVDTVARMGGDEFAILLEEVSDDETVTELAQRIQDELSRPFAIEGHEVFTSASIGIATDRRGYQTPEEVLLAADTAMYRAKNLGKARHQVFDTAMHARAVRHLLLESDLRHALEREELELRYLPVVALADRSAAGLEALLRWNHPRLGGVSQEEFIALAEESGLIVPIGRWVLDRAARELAAWLEQGTVPEGLAVSVNLSARQLGQSDLDDTLAAAVGSVGLTPASVRLEVAEEAVASELETLAETLGRLAASGHSIDIDDFGTGAASLTLLRRVPVGRVKLDRSLVGAIGEDRRSADLVRAILSAASELGIDCVGEGVEEEAQEAALRRAGCPLAQGFLYSRPLPAAEVAGLLARGL